MPEAGLIGVACSVGRVQKLFPIRLPSINMTHAIPQTTRALTPAQPVPLHVMAAFCAHASAHLEAHPRNVVAVHCKAGKGRTGMLVCALLLWRGEAASAGEAMDLYAVRRARDRRGLTVASQGRCACPRGTDLTLTRGCKKCFVPTVTACSNNYISECVKQAPTP